METSDVTTYNCPDPESLQPIAESIIGLHPGKRIFALYGPMGSGKTTLVRSLVSVLGSNDSVSSPTFTIVNEYRSGAGDPIYHFDFYRINSDAEVHDLGFEDYLYSGCYCFIEWPEKVSGFLTGDEVAVTIGVTDSARIISVEK